MRKSQTPHAISPRSDDDEPHLISPSSHGESSVRVLSRLHLATIGVLTLLALLLISFSYWTAALLFLLAGWVVAPLIAATDRLVFDGNKLKRRGAVAAAFSLVGHRDTALQLEAIEAVETVAVRTLRRAGSVRYRYRTEISGGKIRFSFSSGGRNYRQLVATLFPLIPEDKLDARSVELRDYLRDRRVLRRKRAALQIAPAIVLEDTATDYLLKRRRSIGGFVRHKRAAALTRSDADAERGRRLRAVANELRIAGRLRESGEAFRRALLLLPADGWLIYDFARYLFSQASASGSHTLATRSHAALRLAARRAENDSLLLARLGESFAERGDLKYAVKVYTRALDLEPSNYRASIGLAEIALRTAKLAHVVHHYGAAARVAPDAALAQFAQREADYYTRLNADEDYLALEVRRITWLQQIQNAGRAAARVTFTAIAFALVMTFFDASFAALGWSLATSAAFIWIIAALAARHLAARRRTTISI